MNAIANASRWMVAFWVGLTLFAFLWLASAPSTTEFILRAGVLVMTTVMYFLLMHGRPPDQAGGGTAPRVVVMLLALAGLAVVGVFYFRGTLEKISSAILAVTILCLVAEILTGRPRP